MNAPEGTFRMSDMLLWSVREHVWQFLEVQSKALSCHVQNKEYPLGMDTRYTLRQQRRRVLGFKLFKLITSLSWVVVWTCFVLHRHSRLLSVAQTVVIAQLQVVYSRIRHVHVVSTFVTHEQCICWWSSIRWSVSWSCRRTAVHIVEERLGISESLQFKIQIQQNELHQVIDE